MLIAGNPRNSQRGFTYVMILVAVIAMGILTEVATTYASRASQMDREAELLFRGMAYRNAIKAYYESGKPQKRYPKSLGELLKDPRTAADNPRLRTLYTDPMGKSEWKIIRAIDGGISGVASSSTAAPIKTGNFKKGFEKFEGAKSYSDWVFDYVPQSASR
jgi:type II secretory pathway pseudopilin PulG